jgi:hypothetical protein
LGLACGVPKAWSDALLVPPPELEKVAS